MFGIKKKDTKEEKKKKEIEIKDADEEESEESMENSENLVSDDVIETKLNKGFIRARILFEMIGKPKEHIETTMKSYINEIEITNDVVMVSKSFAPVNDLEDGMFSTFCEIDLLVKNVEMLIGFCYTYMPASIELTEPEHINFKNTDFNVMFNDLLLRLHEVSMELKKTLGKIQFAEDNTGKLVFNLIVLSLKAKPKTLDEIYEDTKINKEDIEKFLEHMIKMGAVLKKGDHYGLATVSLKVDDSGKHTEKNQEKESKKEHKK